MRKTQSSLSAPDIALRLAGWHTPQVADFRPDLDRPKVGLSANNGAGGAAQMGFAGERRVEVDTMNLLLASSVL